MTTLTIRPEEKALQTTPAAAEFLAAQAEFEPFWRRRLARPFGTGRKGDSPEYANDFDVLRRRVSLLESRATHYCPGCGAETAGLLSTLDGKTLRYYDWPVNYCPACYAEHCELTQDN